MRELTDAEHFYNGEPVPADDPVCEWCSAVVPNGESAYAPFCSARCQDDDALAAQIEREGDDAPERTRREWLAEERPDPGEGDDTCKHGAVVYRAGDCERYEAEEAVGFDPISYEDAEQRYVTGLLEQAYPDRGGDPDGESYVDDRGDTR